MKLEKYLADYIKQEMAVVAPLSKLQEIIKQGLDAFESTEDVAIVYRKKGWLYPRNKEKE